jgi:hypothetical protein
MKRECEKKGKAESNRNQPIGGGSDSRHSLETFIERLRNVCQDDGPCNGEGRADRIRSQAQHAVAIAAELGILKNTSVTWDDFLLGCTESRIGSEHVVDFDDCLKLVGKTTKPPGFGLIPAVMRLAVAVRPGAPAESREAIEFIAGTPMEYLARWQLNNEIFGDDVKLASVIHWKDGSVSFGITQPQYQGSPADARDIESFFKGAGWTMLNDSSNHKVFFNYAFQVMAIDD